jgi:hypothetical protein
MSIIDDNNNQCDVCKKIYPAGEGYYNPKVGEKGYSELHDICLDCAQDLNLDNCGLCGGVVDKNKLVELDYPHCPNCASLFIDKS